MDRISDGVFSKYQIDEQKIHLLGMGLIRNYCSIEATAIEFRMAPSVLRQLIKTNEVLEIYFEIAHEGIKGLTDNHLIKGLKEGDENIIRLIATRLYAGRQKGGYNISEIGTTGYNDKLGKKLSGETAKDQAKTQVRVTFNFVERDIPVHRQITASTDKDNIIDGDFEDIEDDDKV